MYRSKSGHGSRRSARSDGLFCNYPYRICMQDRYEGFEYCINHILEDKSAPFKQCNFVSIKTGQKCQKAAPKADRKEGYCPAHARKAAQMRHKAALKAKPTDAVRDTLDELDYYRPTSTKSVPEVPSSLATKILDYGSESDSDGDPPLLEQAWRGTTDSDAESVDSEQEDTLKYAGVYTAEEAALITRDKLIRLQSLYINQFKRLQHLMKEKRRTYLVALRQEREAFGIDFGVITDPKQKRKFREYQAARGFRRRKGKEALLYQKSKQRRMQATADYQGKQKVPLMLQCCYKSSEEEQCSKFSLPMAKFCKDHILMDPKQVLYAECSKGNGHCERPASLLSPDESCTVHMSLPDHATFKSYEPEPPPPPPPPPPKPAPAPRRPPTIIPIPEPALPPAPILPSQLDSQLDQLLQFQPHFLEQQLQQHVYDTSQLLGSFSQPDIDVQADSQVQMDNQTPVDTQKPTGSARSHAGKNFPAEKQNTKRSDTHMDSQTDIHIDVETDMPTEELHPDAEPAKRAEEQDSVPMETSDDPATVKQVDTPAITSSADPQQGHVNERLDIGKNEQANVEENTRTDAPLEAPMDVAADGMGSSGDTLESKQTDAPTESQPKSDSAESPHDEEHRQSSISSSERRARRATSDHTYNQEPLDTSETGDQIIDVTGLPGDSTPALDEDNVQAAQATEGAAGDTPASQPDVTSSDTT